MGGWGRGGRAGRGDILIFLNSGNLFECFVLNKSRNASLLPLCRSFVATYLQLILCQSLSRREVILCRWTNRSKPSSALLARRRTPSLIFPPWRNTLPPSMVSPTCSPLLLHRLGREVKHSLILGLYSQAVVPPRELRSGCHASSCNPCEPLFGCKFCGETRLQEKTMKEHLKRVHGNFFENAWKDFCVSHCR